MRRSVRALVVVGLVSAAISIPVEAATADPCGASSWKSGSTQYVGYRNCGSGTSPRMRGVIDGHRGGCYRVPGGESGTLYSRNIGSSALKSWSVENC